MNYVPNTREVIIDRGPMGFGFTLRHPSSNGSGHCEPTYLCGAQVRSVEEKGPAFRGGLDKDEVVAAVNNENVHGKSYLQVINMIQASSRRLSLKVLPASSLEDMANCSAVADETRGSETMEDVAAEKENQLHMSRNADRLSCVSEPPNRSSWHHSPSSSHVDIPVVVGDEAALSDPSAVAADPSGVDPVTLSFTSLMPLRPASADSSEESQLLVRNLEADESDLRELTPIGESLHDSRRERSSTTSITVPVSQGGGSGGGSFSQRLTRSSGHLFAEATAAGGERGPVITVKKAYQQHTVGPPYGLTGEAPFGSASDARLSSLSSSSAGSGSRPVFGVGDEARGAYRVNPYERGVRVQHTTQAEPRINFKKRKSGPNSGGGTGGLTGSRAQSVGHLPASQETGHVSPGRITGLVAHYQPTGGGGAHAPKHRLGASSTHNILTSMPSASRARVASPPSASASGEAVLSGSGHASVGITLMHSPLRRGSSPARSIAAPSPSVPLMGSEDAESGLPYNETRFSVIPDRVVTNVSFRGGRVDAGDGSALPNKHSLQPSSALSRVTWQHQLGQRSQQRTTPDGGVPSSLQTSHSSSPIMQLPSYPSAGLTTTSSSYLLQLQQPAVAEPATSSVTYTTMVTSSCRSRTQQARTQFMEANPTVPPALPLPKVGGDSPPTSRAAETSTSGSGESGSGPGCVTRRDSYYNAVKKNRSTMLSPDILEKSEEHDDGADSTAEDAANSEHHDPASHRLQKAKRFFGEPWARRSGKNKTPKVKEALASGGKESLGVGGSAGEKKFYLSVKVIRDDGKEPKSKSWKSFSLTIENDVMYLMRERKESSASSSSSVEDVPSPIPLRQCLFEWTSPDAQPRKKYLVCRMIVNPPSPPESTSSLAGSAPTTTASPHSTPEPGVSSTALHGSTPPSSDVVTPATAGVSEYKLQFPDSEQMQSFYNCLPKSAASINVIGAPTDFSATFPPGPKAAKKTTAKTGGSQGAKKKAYPYGATEQELAALAGEIDFAGALGSFPSHSKTKLKALVKNFRGWKSSSTESTVTTSSGATIQRTVRYEEYSMRQRSVSPDELGRPLPGCTFGVPLTQVPRSSFSPYVPFVVELCTKIVEACGLHCVGVYRVSPKKAVIDALEAELNECGGRLELIDRSNERWNDVHAVSGLLKCFLRKMPDPLFPHGLYREFVNASNRNLAHERKMLLLQRLLALMEGDDSGNPEYKHHRETLLYLVQHLRRVASHSHVNRMNSKNLASMIAPNVFRAPDSTNPAMIMESTTHGATILELVLNHHEWIFSTDIDAGRVVPPPVTYDIVGHNLLGESCGGEHDQEGGSHNIDYALGGAEDTGGTNRSDVFEYKPGEKGKDILAQLLDAAIACQGDVSREAAAIGTPDEGGFDEVDIDAAVRRRQQLDAAAAAAAASGDVTPAASGSTNGSGSNSEADSGSDS